MAARREVHPALRALRDYLLGRPYKTNNRFADEMAPRPGPQPILPETSFVTISANKYHLRDARRNAAPPIEFAADQKQITEGKEAAANPAPVRYGLPVPGRQFKWNQVGNE
jgi:hypothetical protein